MASYVMGPATAAQRHAMAGSHWPVVVSPDVPTGTMLFVDDGCVVFRAVWTKSGWHPVEIPRRPEHDRTAHREAQSGPPGFIPEYLT